MQRDLPLQFVFFDFLGCYHIDNGFYRWEDTQQYFDEDVAREAAQPNHPKLGSPLHLEQWNTYTQGLTGMFHMAIVQVLDISPWKNPSDTTSTDCLHELMVVTWYCISPIDELLPSTRYLKLKRGDCCILYARLPTLLKHFATHGYQKRHLGLVLSMEDLGAWSEYSQDVEKTFMDEVERGATYLMGDSVQEARVNDGLYYRAKWMRLFVFDLIDVSIVTVTEEEEVPCELANLILKIHVQQDDEVLPNEDLHYK